MRLLGVLSAALLAVAVAACGSSSGSGGGGTATTAACPKGAVVIHMRNISFQPGTATASVGQEVCWVNDDGVQHDAVADSGQFKSQLFGEGETFTTKLTKAGPVTYVCTVHPGMTAKLVVKP